MQQAQTFNFDDELSEPRRRVVLLVEDDNDLRDLLAAALQRDGFDVKAFDHGTDAQGWLDNALRRRVGLPDLIITDERLPGASGTSLLEHAGKQIPAILITGFGSKEVYARARELGADFTMQKPFDVDDFRTAVRNVMDKKASIEQARVLIVDDDEDIRWGLASLFEMYGAHVRTAAGGLEALRLLAERGPFDLVITDVRMPPPSGVQLVAMARTAGADVPFFVITAYPEDPTIHRALPQLDNAELIGKPFDPHDLVKKAFHQIRRDRSRQAS